MLLELKHVEKSYPGPDPTSPVSVLRGVSLQMQAGESVAVTGPSGSGKSTLLNIVAALDRPSGGEVLLAGRPLANLPDRELAAIRNRDIGLVFQLHHLLPQCSVLENVLLPTLPRGRSVDAGQAARRARELLDRVGLGPRAHHRPGQLSGGESQRVAVVRALINEPSLLLADEPTGSLDHATASRLTQLLAELNAERGVALLMVTHSPELAARMGRQFALRDGVLQECRASP